MDANFTDEEIQKQLAGEAVRGPRVFRGRELAELTKGLRDLRNKVLAPDDTAAFHDLALLHILAEAHAVTPEARLARRRALLVATDDVPTFRAVISLQLDELTDEEEAEADRVTNEILGIVEKAEVVLAEKKSEVEGLVEPSLMMTLLPCGSSQDAPDGVASTSDGSYPLLS